MTQIFFRFLAQRLNGDAVPMSLRISETRQRPPERSTQNTHRIRGFRQAAAAANRFRSRIDSENIGDAVLVVPLS